MMENLQLSVQGDISYRTTILSGVQAPKSVLACWLLPWGWAYPQSKQVFVQASAINHVDEGSGCLSGGQTIEA